MGRERISLQAFQAQLSHRMQAALDDVVVHDSRLAVMVGSLPCLFALGETAEVVALPAMTMVPLTKPWYLGLVNIRGTVLGVVDYAHFCGESLQRVTAESRLLVPSAALPTSSALLVSRVVGIRHLADFTPVANTPEVDGHMPLYLDTRGQVWREVRLQALMADVHFLQIGQ